MHNSVLLNELQNTTSSIDTSITSIALSVDKDKLSGWHFCKNSGGVSNIATINCNTTETDFYYRNESGKDMYVTAFVITLDKNMALHPFDIDTYLSGTSSGNDVIGVRDTTNSSFIHEIFPSGAFPLTRNVFGHMELTMVDTSISSNYVYRWRYHCPKPIVVHDDEYFTYHCDTDWNTGSVNKVEMSFSYYYAE